MRFSFIILLLTLLGASAFAQQPNTTFPGTVHVVYGRDALFTATPVGRFVSDGRGFLARVAYDEQALYVMFEVMSQYPFINSYADYMTVFKGGNCLDIQLGADAQADPARKEPVPGDVRVLVVRQPEPAKGAGKVNTLAVIYRPKVKDFKGTPITFRTVNTITFDVIEKCPDVQLQDYRTFPNGFLAIVKVPLKVIGLTPTAGMKIKMDLGYRFGNETGNQIGMRTYWQVNSFNSNVIYDVPCESTLEPNLWGTAVFDPAPAKAGEKP